MACRVEGEEARRGYNSADLRKCITERYPSVVDRYYRKLYKINLKGHEGEDYCILLHSNRICLITLAPSHPILKEKKTVTKVDFQINKRTNRLNNPLSGKRKRGAQQLVEDAALCIVKCEDGSTYQPCGCIKGSLIEANENLITKPHLLSTKPDTEGYIAIVLTKLQDHKQEIGKLLTTEQYREKMEERTKKHCQSNTKRSPSAETKDVESDGSSDKIEECNISKNIKIDSNHADSDESMETGHISQDGINATMSSDAVKDKDVKTNNISDNVKLAEGYQNKEIKDGDT